MPAIVIRTTLTSDTPHLPELAPLIGKEVEIRVSEPAPPVGPPHARPLTPDEIAILDECAEYLRNSPTFDWDAITKQDAVDIADQTRRWAEGDRDSA